MKHFWSTLTLLLISTAWMGCDGAIDSLYQPQVVVTGYIYANGAIDSVILHTTAQFGTVVDDLSSAITGATVKIIVDNTVYTLLPGTRKGRYYLPASQLTVQGGKTYELRVLYQQDSIEAFTTVPMPIHFTGLDDSIPPPRILILDTNNQAAFIHILTAGPVDSPDRRYQLQVTALDTTFGKIHAGSNAGPPLDSNSVTRFSFVQTGPILPLYSRLFGWWGPNKISFLAIDTNWVDLARQVQSGTADTYQPSLNHIIGGLGVWASAARDTTTVFLEPKK